MGGYIDSSQDLRGDANLWDFLKPKLQKQFCAYSHIQVTNLDGRKFIKPLSSEISLDKYEYILGFVNKDLSGLGLAGTNILRQLHGLDELIAGYDSSMLWIVGEIGTEIHGRVDLTNKENKKETAHFNCNESCNGRVFGDAVMTIGKDKVYLEIKNPLICIRADGPDTVDIYMSLFSESLHSRLRTEHNALLRRFFKYVSNPNGSITYNAEDITKAETIANLVDESVVHGLSHLWLKDNLSNFGLTEQNYVQELEQKESILRYKGVKVIRELAAKMGRKELVDDYRSNPAKYWDIIKSQVPEYKDF